MAAALPTGAVQAELRLASLDAYVLAAHGEERALNPDEVAVLAAWGSGIVAYVQARWPVDTGTSRDMWTFEVNPSPGEMAIVVENEMFYAEFVYRRGDPLRTPLWDRLIGEAWGLAREPLLLEARTAVDATEVFFQRERARRDDEREALRRTMARRAKREPIRIFGFPVEVGPGGSP